MKDKLLKEAKELPLGYTLEMETRSNKFWPQARLFQNFHKQKKKN